MDRLRRSPLYDIALGAAAVLLGAFVAIALLVGTALLLVRIAGVFG